MKTKGLLLLVFSLSFSLCFSQSGESKLKEVSISKKKSFPPNVVLEMLYSDNDKNQKFDAGESAKLIITLRNKGQGDASGLVLAVTEESKLAGITFGIFEKNIGSLSANSEKSVEIDITAAQTLPEGNAMFKVSMTEADGFNPESVKLAVTTQKQAEPALSVSDHKFSCQEGGPIKLDKEVMLTLVVTNSGEASAQKVIVNFVTPLDITASGKTEYSFTTLFSGEKQLVSFTFVPTSAYSKTEIPVTVTVKDETGKFGLSQVIKVGMNESLDSYQAMSDNNTVYRGGGDPLKGLDVSDAKKDMQIGDYYALIIGIDEYSGTWSKLSNAVNDAKAIEDVLKTKYKFDYFKTLYNSDASRKSIIKEMEWLVENVKAKDNVFIYYSGHGEFKESLNKGYWVPADALTASTSGYVSNSELQTFLGGIRSKHTLLVSDACFSGDIFRGTTVTVPFEQSSKYYSKVHNLASRKAISSGGIEPVMDGGRDGHSVFAYYMLKALKSNTEQMYDASQLFENIKIPVINNSEQSPAFNPIKGAGDEGGQFIFFKK